MQSLFSRRCFINGTLQAATLTLSEGKIVAIASEKLPHATDCGDAVIMSGCIDAHVHINEPGRSDWEGFVTATQAAAAGGVTTLIDMPLNSSPVTTTVAALEAKKQASLGKMYVNCGFYGGLVPQNVSDIENLLQDPHILGIKCFLVHSGIDEFENVSAADLHRAAPVLARYQKPLLAHCEIPDNSPLAYTDAPPDSYARYLASRPKSWENKAIALMIDLCRTYRCRTHIVHVASAEALPLIAAAKQEGLPLTAETCPHYIFFNAETIPDHDTRYKCAPPIREQANNELLKAALKSGGLDFVASDHSPAPPAIKHIDDGDLQAAWGGIASVQFLLPAAWTALRNTLTLEAFIPLLTTQPARFLGIAPQKGHIAVGSDADLVVWQPEADFEVQSEHIFFKHKISPYLGKHLYGKVQKCCINGKWIDHNSAQHNNFYSDKNTAGKWLITT
ncbi:MAG: allantoinase AllB [Sphingobacteriales bacterium]|nr:allantoinase AllB [Sphingobacteriales bacterium]